MGEVEEQLGWGFETRPCTRASHPIPRAARSSPRSPCRRPSPRTASAPQGVRVLPLGQSDARCPRGVRRLARDAAHGLAFASGLAAEDNVLRLLSAGQRVLLGNDAYGGTFRLIAKVHGPAGIQWSAVDLTDIDALRRDWPADTAMVWLETPTNPLLTCIDIEAVAAVAHEHGALVVVDNTFATPYLQQPLRLGADVVVHSATKYLGGHSDVVGGFLALDDDEHAGRLRFTQNAAGAVPAPFDCYLVLRGVKTRRCAWNVTAPMHERSSTCCSAIPPSAACSTPNCPTTPVTVLPPSRCATSAGW